MEKLYELKEVLMDSLEDFDTIKGGELKMGELEALQKLTDTIKNVDKICAMEDGGYSADGDWEAEMRGKYGRSSSYGRHYVRGHYSRDGQNDGGYSGARYSGRKRDSRGRYSRDSMMDHLEEMMDGAGSEKERDAIRRCMSQLENA